MSDLISIIVPVYNVEKYLKRCVKSIINQTYKNLEIILVDDGSTDKSPLICDEFCDERIKVIHKENGGLSDARNAGLKICKGAFISFIDSDDYIENDMIEILYNRIISDKSDICVCNFKMTDDNGNILREDNQVIEDCILNKNEYYEKLSKPYYWCYVTAWNKLYKKEVLSDFEFKKGKIHEDEFAICDIIKKCDKISCIKKPLYFYIQRENSIMHRKFSIKNMDFAEAMLERADFGIKNNLNLAVSSFTMATDYMKIIYEKADKNDENAKKRILFLEKRIKEVYKKIKKQPIGIRKKIRFFIFKIKMNFGGK